MGRPRKAMCMLSISLIICFGIVEIAPSAVLSTGTCACVHRASSPCCVDPPLRPHHRPGPAPCPVEGVRFRETASRGEEAVHRKAPASSPGHRSGMAPPLCRSSNPDHRVALQGPAVPVRSGHPLAAAFHSEAPRLPAQTLRAPTSPLHGAARAAPPPAYLVIASFRC